MLKPTVWRFCLGLLIAAVPAFATTGHAQTKVGERIGDWTFQCQAISAKETICALTQAFINKQANQRILTLTLRPFGPDKKLMLFALLPLGVYLPTGLTGTIDDGTPFFYTWQRCTNQGCEASTEIDATRRTAMKAGKVLAVSFKGQADAEPLVVSASLKGITQGLKELGVE